MILATHKVLDSPQAKPPPILTRRANAPGSTNAPPPKSILNQKNISSYHPSKGPIFRLHKTFATPIFRPDHAEIGLCVSSSTIGAVGGYVTRHSSLFRVWVQR